MTAAKHRGLAFVRVALALALPWPAPAARAATEEFSTFDVAAQEEDDESLLDHMLTRTPRTWRGEWERAPLALRTSQGCLTSGQWFINTDLKLRSPLGRSARLGVDYRQSETDFSSYEHLDFSFRFPTRFGTPGAMFRPLYDKSRQDFAVMWEAGSDTGAFQSALVFTLEDMFNNLWAFRQTRVGEGSEPYERHPYEPALRLRGSGPSWRAEVYGQYLTPSRKRVVAAGPLPVRLTGLWGTLGAAELEVEGLGFTWELCGTNQQASDNEQPVDLSAARSESWRRRWTAETSVARSITPRLGGELRALYQSRTQSWGGPPGDGAFDGIDRLFQLDTWWEVLPTLRVRTGALYDRIGIASSGFRPYATYGTRTESRAYLGLSARFGRVSVEAIEGIELDPEPYEVWMVHDKGFLHLQTTF